VICVGGTFWVLWIAVKVSEYRGEQERIADAKPLNANAAILDYKRNPVRYNENWSGEYVTFSGRVRELYSYKFEFAPISTSRQSSTVVNCDFELSEAEKVAMLDNGDYARVAGKMELKELRSGQFQIELRDCRLR